MEQATQRRQRATRQVQKEYRKEVVDVATGEVKTTEHITQSTIPVEPDFIKLYLKDVMYLQDLPAGLNAVLYQLLMRIEYDGTVTINMAHKKIIAERIKLSVSTVNAALTQFVKGNILERVDKGIYRANPYLFGKGRWSEIHSIRMEVTYSLGGKTIKSVIDKKGNGEEVQNDSEG